MTEAEARSWVAATFDVSRGTMEKLDTLAALIREESTRQNLVSAATLPVLWQRHIADSAQLLQYCANPDATWLDLGSGPGLPGLVIAALNAGAVTLVEERRLRIDFLHRAAAAMNVDVEIVGTKLERMPPRPFEVISARAFAPLARLLPLATAFSTENSLWVLPKGQNAQAELEALDPSWQGDFRLEPSITDPEARIIVATGVRQERGKRR